MSPALTELPSAAKAHRRLDPARPLLRRLQRSYLKLDAEQGGLPAFRLRLDDGEVHEFGQGEAAFSVLVHGRRGRAALASFDETRICEAFMAGVLDLEGDMLALLRLRPLMSDRHPFRSLWNKVLHPLVYGQAASDRKWIADHYDEDPDFYRLFLDQRKCYSHGIFQEDDEPLDTAILRKLDFALSSTGARAGQRILDIGAGWGAMTRHAGRRGIHATSLTISEPSEAFVNDLIARERLPCQVLREHFLEFRSAEPFDAIVNLGVTEHLPDYRATLAQYERLLRPGGRVYLDACAARTKFPFSSFTFRYIFPGNATPLCLHDYLTEVAETPFEVVALYNDRHSYELTCRHWAEKLERSEDEIVRRWGKGLYRRFQIYLWGCVDVFSRDVFGAYRMVLELGPRATSLSRREGGR